MPNVQLTPRLTACTASAFWNLEGVGLKLLRLLPAVRRRHMQRIISEASIESWSVADDCLRQSCR